MTEKEEKQARHIMRLGQEIIRLQEENDKLKARPLIPMELDPNRVKTKEDIKEDKKFEKIQEIAKTFPEGVAELVRITQRMAYIEIKNEPFPIGKLIYLYSTDTEDETMIKNYARNKREEQKKTKQ